MRLLNTTSLDIEDFVGSDVPKYAILSHTWDNHETTLQEWTAYRKLLHHHIHRSLPRPKPRGHAKIEGFCQVARSDGHEYVWIDTCCIDKTSSAELTESINSMFQWYKRASACYAYLSDFGDLEESITSLPSRHIEDCHPTSFYEAARNCRWFTRGWTLEELIAPCDVRFYDGAWRPRGTRDAHSRDLEAITSIDYSVLLGPRNRECVAPAEYSVADRMSWASSRRTKRSEDIAYCLLGLFDVNMPLIYGEGMGVFRRLQEAIMRNSNDLSILAWGMSHTSEEKRRETWLQRAESGYFTGSGGTETGNSTIEEDESIWSELIDEDDKLSVSLLIRSETMIEIGGAPSLAVRLLSPPALQSHAMHRNLFASAPSDFAHSRHISKPFRHFHNPEFTMTNKGLRIKARIFKGVYDGGTTKGYFLYLAEQELFNPLIDSGKHTEIWLRLRKVWIDIYVPEALVENTGDDEVDFGTQTGLMSFYISNRPHEDDTMRQPSSGIHVPGHPCIHLKRSIPESHWDETRQLFYEPDEADPVVLAAEFEAQFSEDARSEFIVLFDRTITCDEMNPFLCRVLDCRQYPREAEWIFSNRGPRNTLLWCDLEYNMKVIMECGSDIQIELDQGVTVHLEVGLDLQRMWTLQFSISADEMEQDDCR